MKDPDQEIAKLGQLLQLTPLDLQDLKDKIRDAPGYHCC